MLIGEAERRDDAACRALRRALAPLAAAGGVGASASEVASLVDAAQVTHVPPGAPLPTGTYLVCSGAVAATADFGSRATCLPAGA